MKTSDYWHFKKTPPHDGEAACKIRRRYNVTMRRCSHVSKHTVVSTFDDTANSLRHDVEMT